MIAEVVLPVPLDKSFYYTVPDNLQLTEGDYVRVPFGNRRASMTGLVVGLREDIECDVDLKSISCKLPIPAMQLALIKFIRWTSYYNMVPIGAVLKMVFCGMQGDKFLSPTKTSSREESTLTTGDITHSREVEHVQLSHDQNVACNYIMEKISGFSAIVLDGETGSGKTEVYCEAIRRFLQNSEDAQILILLPEIILASQLMKKVHDYFSSYNPIVWHSELTAKKRREGWRAVVDGVSTIVVGARSALFLPFKNLKMIIVDEEHESSFKQDHGINYNARDMAVVLAKQANIPVILSSATPTLETIYNVKQGKYHHIVLRNRFGMAVMPDITVVDMRKDKLVNTWLSCELFESISAIIARGEQAMLFLNRRGYAHLVLCSKCGHKINCPNCSTWLAEHRMLKILLCHHCGHSSSIPTRCENCLSENAMIAYGVGVEKVAECIERLIPGVRIGIVSSDSSTKCLNSVIGQILSGEVDVIVGTQIIAKGHNFPKLMLVGVIDADLGLGNSDLRASEKTYQLLHQVSGRSGRFEGKGRVVLQTHDPENNIVKSLLSHDRENFYEAELQSRMVSNMPPYARLIAIVISGKDEQKVISTANEVALYLSNHMVVWGPALAPIGFINKMHRYRLLIRTQSIAHVRNPIIECRDRYKKFRHVKITVDVDPINFA